MRLRYSGWSAAQEEEAHRNTHWILRSLERLREWLDHNRSNCFSSSQAAAWTSDSAACSGGSAMENPFADESSPKTLGDSFSESSASNQHSPFSACHFASLHDPFDSF